MRPVPGDGSSVLKAAESAVVAALHDRMTQCRYTEPLTSFALTVKPEQVYEVDIMGQGKEALVKANADLGRVYCLNASKIVLYICTFG